MMTVKQVSKLAGVSVRTLQFYDEIGLLKPTDTTAAGYRLYDDEALETLQQILFFKELDFTLKEIQIIMNDPLFNRETAFRKQRELIQLKRDRLNSLLGLLDKLIKGEKCMDFKDFDMSEYFRILNEFKETHTDEIVKRMGNMDAFDAMFSDLKSREKEIADMAVKQYGSIEAFTSAMEKSFQDFLSGGPAVSPTEAGSLIEKTDEITRRLTADLAKDVSSPEVQDIVRELVAFTNECNKGIDMGENYWPMMAENYLSVPVYIEVTDKKYGEGASNFMGRALKCYLDGK
ncbi:MerR family transcriptional regulator [Lachnospiraceae bacterium ASD3451]|uniref:MerR family transcriptional regulator n=2 Tax=Diplocloster agilis TaxID=2850323 RepID=A0A949N9P3_9FIRM|nr:MerR family transcriptional regulator [Diplocloster agilis]MBU9735587.1 MerR family transcriptional regulator [Diplocloster agilis]MBU9742406.1 MerR family transcriptional regulator [Diplocloster agilis]